MVELIVSLALTCVATVAIGSVLLTGLRTYSRQIELARVRANLRAAMATLTSELRGLDAGDRQGSDIVEMDRSSLTYRASRSTYFLCMVPNLAASTVTVWRNPHASLRQVEAGRDSVLLYAENDEAIPDDDEWLTAALSSVTTGGLCPGEEPGLRLAVQGVFGGALDGVRRGAVVRGFQLTRILLYSGTEGRSWIGFREMRPAAGWSITQPILGPVDQGGLRFDYFRADGGIANRPADVARISIKVVGVGYLPAGTGGEPVRDSLTIHVGLRNNPLSS